MCPVIFSNTFLGSTCTSNVKSVETYKTVISVVNWLIFNLYKCPDET